MCVCVCACACARVRVWGQGGDCCRPQCSPLLLFHSRMIHVLDPRPLTSSVMPVDMAMRICLAHSPPLKSFLGPYNGLQRRHFVNKPKPLKPCLSVKQEAKSQKEWKSPHSQAKKRVVFADSKGLSLTAIHVFSDLPEEPAWDLQFDLLQNVYQINL